MDLDAINGSDVSDFKLGDWWIRPQRNELERAGEAVHVEARSMEVLVCLGRHAPGVVDKERLLQEVWRGSFVGDDVISHAIWELRKALGDSARDPAYIQTVPRKGYRLVAEILRPQGSPLPMAGVRIDHYDLGDEIGRGAMGVVYQAVDRRLGRTVAIKFLASELTRDAKASLRFQREARLAASLDHPNLATVHEVGETAQGYRYLVSAYYRGGSLKDRLAGGPIEAQQALSWVRQLVAGLGAAHQRDIIHRDVKPANLLLDEHGTLKICDFGIAKLLGATDLTRTGATLGTPAYKSPEQAQCRPVDHRTDLWSAGVVLFELIAGHRPFEGEEHGVTQSIVSREPQLEGDSRGRPVPEPVRRFIGRALAKDPAERFQSADEMTAALDRLESSESGPAAWAGRSWRWVQVGAGILALVATLWLLKILMKERAPEGPGTAGAEQTTDSREGRDRLTQGRDLWLRGYDSANLQRVRQHFEAAVALLPKSAEAKAHLAAFLAKELARARNAEERERARELIRGALALDERSSLARAAEAHLLILEGEIDEAKRLALEAIDIEPECDTSRSCDLAYLMLGEIHYIQGRVEEALETLDTGSQVGGGRIRCRLKRAQILDKEGMPTEAEAEYQQVLVLDPVQTSALKELADLLLRERDADEAIPLLRRLYERTREPNVLISIGYEQYLQKLWADALETYQQAHEAYLAAGKQVPTPLTAIGDVYLAQGKKTEAQVWYKQAAEIFEDMEDPNIGRQGQYAVCLAKLDRFADAVPRIERLSSLYAEDVPNLLVYAGRIHALAGDREKLLDLARRWMARGGQPSRFWDDDPAFLPYHADREYIRILRPGLISDD
ncbi:MAG: protein kinase [bacterium]|nr:protein kinase [bacterium]